MKNVTLGGPKELDDAFNCMMRNPQRSVEICDKYLIEHPGDTHALFMRFQALGQLGEHDKALADIDRVLELKPNSGGYSARGKFFHDIGDHQRAIDDLTRARTLDDDEWKTSLDPHYRADSLARLGRLDDALSDCAFIPDDHWMPALSGLPAGNKQQFVDEIKRRALLARTAKT
jgi:tetratricopeptide (TPR) repeat protein